jgi:hypothetical protein
MAAWLNFVSISAPANGTAVHAVDPATSGTVIAGAPFVPTAGRLLMCVAEGAVTSTTPAGWALPANGSAINNTGLYVWTKTAAGGDTLSTTHNGNSYPVSFSIFEFAAGTSFVKAAKATAVANGVANPSITGLVGPLLVMAAAAGGDTTVGGTVVSATWDSPNLEALDYNRDRAAGGNDGFWLGIVYQEAYAGATYAPTPTVSGTVASHERLTWALQLAAGGPTPLALAGRMDAAGGGLGVLGRRAVLRGRFAGASGSSGRLRAAAVLRGSVAGASGAGGDVSLLMVMRGVLAGQSGGAGRARLLAAMRGALVGQSGFSLRWGAAAVLQLVGRMDSASGGDGLMRSLWPMRGRMDAAGGAGGRVRVGMPLRGRHAAVSAGQGRVLAAVVLRGRVAGASAGAGRLRVSLGLRGAMAAVAGFSGRVTVQGLTFLPARLGHVLHAVRGRFRAARGGTVS